jgi:hypothetical protein
MTSFNDGLPSAADSFGDKQKTASETAKDVITAAEDFATDIGQRGAERYKATNTMVAERIDPLPGLLLAATAGFIAGCIWSSSHSR